MKTSCRHRPGTPQGLPAASPKGSAEERAGRLRCVRSAGRRDIASSACVGERSSAGAMSPPLFSLPEARLRFTVSPGRDKGSLLSRLPGGDWASGRETTSVRCYRALPQHAARLSGGAGPGPRRVASARSWARRPGRSSH